MELLIFFAILFRGVARGIALIIGLAIVYTLIHFAVGYAQWADRCTIHYDDKIYQTEHHCNG